MLHRELTLTLALILGAAPVAGCNKNTVAKAGHTASAEDCRKVSERLARLEMEESQRQAMTQPIEVTQARVASIKTGSVPRGDYYYELGAVLVAQSNEPGTSYAEQHAKRREAITSFSKAVDVDPTIYRAHYQIGVLHEQLDEPEEADSAYRKCIELNAQYSPCYVLLGNMYIDYGFANVAMAVLETGTMVNETDADMWNGIGRALLNLGRPREAVEAYKRARRIDPDKPDVLFGLGMAYAEIPMRKEAEATLNEFLSKASGVPSHIIKAAQDTIYRMQGI